MTILSRIRLYHAVMAVLTATAYLTGEAGLVHAWLGYGVAVVLATRLIWGVVGDRQVGLMRFYPVFERLKLGNALTHPAISRSLILGILLLLVATVGTGVAMDKGRALGLADIALAAPAYADDDDSDEPGGHERHESFLGELHEAVANLLMLTVGVHVTYLFLFKRPLARFMLFASGAGQRAPRPDRQNPN